MPPPPPPSQQQQQPQPQQQQRQSAEQLHLSAEQLQQQPHRPPHQQRAGGSRLSTASSLSSSSPSLSAAAASPSPSSASAPASASSPHLNGNSDNFSPPPRLSSSSVHRPPPPPPPPPPAARPGLFSRLSLPLSLPLRNRNRNLVDFHIRCDEPYRKYSAGDLVRGVVALALVKPLRITHLVVSLHGYVRVLRDPASAAKAQLAPALPSHGASNRPQYHGHGLASLFQDEQVLSGEGRIETGRYEFGFELVFPDKELPSSIDFERGTISYLITATLTRPTTIAPTTTCDRRVTLSQMIDIGLLPPPRPRTIFLEPISKRTRRKRAAALDKSAAAAADINDLASEADSIDRSITTADDASRDGHADARPSHAPSDVLSEISGESGRSASTAVSRADLAQLSQVSSAMTPAAKQQVVDDKTITATITLIKGGCLPGDTVSVRIRVQHIKRVKSMTGVIVTLFRQGKIDTSPPATSFTDEPADEPRRADKEELYPRSRTGLAGLSLSSTGSTSMFRKDLDQNAAPLIIDPVTLQASVTVSVKVPDDVFPTIKGVPGDMISFKYQVEVVVDLGGRLASQLQGGQSRPGPHGYGGSEQGGTAYNPRRPVNIADTAQLRREKGVISVSMETVVGSVDSSRGRKPAARSPDSRTIRIAESDDEEEAIRPESGHRSEASPSYFSPNGPPHDGLHHHHHHHHHHHQSVPQTGQRPRRPSEREASQVNGHYPDAAPSYVPPPQLPDESSLSEKDRIRQAETRLLPSQPPGQPPTSADGGPSSAAMDDDIYDADDTPRRPRSEPSAPALDDMDAGPSAPTEEELTAGQPAESKQELERQRLLNEASAPPEFPEDAERRGEGPAPGSRDTDAPSAPVLDEDGDDYSGYGVGAGPPSASAGGHDAEQLPAYKR